MRGKFVFLIAAAFFLFAMANAASAITIANENFEGGASGWSFNTTTVNNPNFTEFLGQFAGTGGAQTVFKTFSLSGTQTSVTIAFDFYEIDSWDTEFFRVWVDNAQIINDSFQHTSLDNPASATPLLGNGFTNYGFAHWSDQLLRYSLTANTTATSLKLGFGSNLNSGTNDESWGIDNLLITDNSQSQTGAIPEPTTMLLFGSGLIGLAGFRRKFKRN